MEKSFSILWESGCVSGKVDVTRGVLASLKAQDCDISGNNFTFGENKPCRLEVSVSDAALAPGAFACIVHIYTKKDPFSFFLRDVNKLNPIYIIPYNVIVTENSDSRDYRQIVEDIKSRGRLTRLEQIENEAEESYENAANHTINQSCPAWLGISRDMRIFEVGIRGEWETWDWVAPKYNGRGIKLSGLDDDPVRYSMMTGRGIGSYRKIERHIEKGCIPVLTSIVKDDEIEYTSRYFVTLEKSKLIKENISGTHHLVADLYAYGGNFTQEQLEMAKKLEKSEIDCEEETVMYISLNVKNTGSAPRYSFVRIPDPLPGRRGYAPGVEKPFYDGSKGMGFMPDKSVYLVAFLNEKPVPQQEMSILLQPESQIEFNFILPRLLSCLCLTAVFYLLRRRGRKGWEL